jgi:signal recognition particle subunit SRP54
MRKKSASNGNNKVNDNKERQNPNLLNASRRRRIALGSGTKVSDINKLINGYENSKKMMKQFSGKMGKKGKMNFPFM